MTSDDEICRAAIAHYGEPAQVLKAIEEMAELIHELILSLYIPGGNAQMDNMWDCSEYIIKTSRAMAKKPPANIRMLGVDNLYKNVKLECADVENMLNQLRIIFGPWDDEKNMKNERLMERINNESPQ